MSERSAKLFRVGPVESDHGGGLYVAKTHEGALRGRYENATIEKVRFEDQPARVFSLEGDLSVGVSEEGLVTVCEEIR